MVLLALAVFGAGIRGTYRAMFPGQGLYRMVAVVEQAPRDGVVVVTHDAVSGLMGQMSSMALFAESQAALDRADLRAGDRARFTLRQLPEQALDRRRPEDPLTGQRTSPNGVRQRRA